MSDFDKSDDPRRRLIIRGLAAGVFSSALPAADTQADAIWSAQPAKLPPGQSIYRLRGSVAVNGKEASLSTLIGPNDTVETGKDSEIVFAVGGNAMILRGDSKIAMKGSESDTGSFLISALRILAGKILSVSRNKGMSVRTPTATIGIRGTGFYIEVEPDLTYFCTCYGTTDVIANSDPASKETVVATHHDRPLYITDKGQAGHHIRNAGYRDHTDQELMLIEALVGRTPPFAVSGNGYDPFQYMY